MRRSVALAVVAACNFASGTPESADAQTPDDWLEGFSYRKQITITAGDAALPDFAVSVLTTADDDLVRARPGGTDLVFTAADGRTILGSEVVEFDDVNGALDAWVRVTTLPAQPTIIFLYYGGPATTPPHAWSSRFAGVWHMSGADELRDSTLAGHHAMPPNELSTPATAAGIAGTARLYDGVDDSATAADPPDGSLDFPLTSFSVSTWVYVTQTAGNFDTPLHKGGSSAGNPGYDFELGLGSWYVGLHDTVANPRAQFGTDVTLSNKWAHLVATVDRELDVLTSYTNSVVVTTTMIPNLLTLDTDNALDIGRAGQPFDGLIDEVRIYAGALSPAWIAAEYRNIADRASFVAIGPQESLPQN